MNRETSIPKVLKEFETVISSSYREASSFFPKDRVPLGFFCPHVPEELIHAAGGFAFRLMGAPVKMVNVQAHLPANCCHLAKSSLESYLQGELDFLKGIIFSHTCDIMQGLAEIWAFQKRLSLQFNLMTPSQCDSELSRPYLKAELERFKTFLESSVGKITLQNLRASIQLFNGIRAKLQEIYVGRCTSPNQISGTDFARIIRAGYLMDRLRYLELLDILSSQLPVCHRVENRVPVYITGNMPHSDFYFSLIEEAGAVVVQDDLCSGARFLSLTVPDDADPMDGLTSRYFNRFLCPTQHNGAYAHLETLSKEVEKCGAKGVIFILYKYCESHFFDYPDLKDALESRGVPSLLVEVEDPSYSVGQLKTRIQAFVEMLSPL